MMIFDKFFIVYYCYFLVGFIVIRLFMKKSIFYLKKLVIYLYL